MGGGRRGQLTTAVTATVFAALVLLGLGGCKEDQLQVMRALNNHAKHVALNMDCASCHLGARQTDKASIPSIDKCQLCHDPKRSDPPTPARLASFIKAGKDVPWVRVNRLPGDVFFSHMAHVKLAKMECKECHGEVKSAAGAASRPVVRPPDMNSCIDCHRQRGASVDCLTCHK